MGILLIVLPASPSKTMFSDLRIRNCAFHEHMAYFYLRNLDVFHFIMLVPGKLRIILFCVVYILGNSLEPI